MKKIAKLSEIYFFEIGIGLLFVLLSIKYPFVNLLNFFCLCSLMLVLNLFYHGKKKKNEAILFAVLYLILQFIYLLLAQRTGLWYLSFLGIFFILGINYFFFYRPNPDKFKKTKFFKEIILVGVFLVAVLPLVYFLAQSIVIKSNENKLAQDAKDINLQIDKKQKNTLEQARTIASDEIIKKYLPEKKYSEIGSYAQNLMMGQNLSFLIVTDKDGVVVARAHRPKSVGDNIAKQIPEAKDVLSGKDLVSIAQQTSDSLFFSAAGVPIRDTNGNIAGAVFAGYLLNDQFAKEISSKEDEGIAFFAGEALFGKYSAESEPYKIFNLSGLSAIVNGSEIDQTQFIRFDNKNYLIELNNIPNSNGSSFAKFALLKNADFHEEVGKLTAVLFMIISFSFAILLFLQMGQINENSAQGLQSKSKMAAIKFYLSASGKFIVNSIKTNKKLTISLLALLLTLSMIAETSQGELSNEILDKNFYSLKNDPIVKNQKKPTITTKLDKVYAKTGETLPLKIYVQRNNIDVSSVVISLEFSFNLQGLSFDTSNSACKKIDMQDVQNSLGNATFSCELSMDQSEKQDQLFLTTINFQPEKSGVGNFYIEPRHSYVLSKEGDQTEIVQNLINGDNLLITE